MSWRSSVHGVVTADNLCHAEYQPTSYLQYGSMFMCCDVCFCIVWHSLKKLSMTLKCKYSLFACMLVCLHLCLLFVLIFVCLPCSGTGNTPLHVATIRCRIDAVLTILDTFGDFVDVNCQNNVGDTPLLIACRYVVGTFCFWCCSGWC